MNDRRVCFGLAVVAAAAVGIVFYTWTSKDANMARAAMRDSLADDHAEEAARMAQELEGALGGIATLETALADSGVAWRAREGNARADQRRSERIGSDVAARLRAQLDSVGAAMVDSIQAAADERVAAVEVVAERWEAEAHAQEERGDSIEAALYVSIYQSGEWESAYHESRIASETKDAIIRATKLQRNVTSVVTLASVALNVIQAVGGSG